MWCPIIGSPRPLLAVIVVITWSLVLLSSLVSIRSLVLVRRLTGLSLISSLLRIFATLFLYALELLVLSMPVKPTFTSLELVSE